MGRGVAVYSYIVHVDPIINCEIACVSLRGTLDRRVVYMRLIISEAL